MTQRPPFFPHRKNKDGTFDSICLKCLATVVRTKSESELEQHDKRHVCEDDMFSAKKGRFGPTRLPF
jgi:hypothetical protein